MAQFVDQLRERWICNKAGCCATHCYIDPESSDRFNLGTKHFNLWATALTRSLFVLRIVQALIASAGQRRRRRLSRLTVTPKGARCFIVQLQPLGHEDVSAIYENNSQVCNTAEMGFCTYHLALKEL